MEGQVQVGQRQQQQQHELRADQRSYNSPSMQYYHQHAPPEAYRASPQQHLDQTTPTAATVPQLPPIQHFEGQIMQSQQYAAGIPPPPPHAHHHHAPPFSTPQYQYPNGLPPSASMPSNVGANGQNGGIIRFPIQPQPGMQAPGTRSKKDIKRRTKTGCLTCRKRRIKCDETHPSCRNCIKSKRECLGYDPIFKQQSGPHLIVPAPSTSSVPTGTPPQRHQQTQDYHAQSRTYSSARQNRGLAYPVDSFNPDLNKQPPPVTMASSNYSSMLLPSRKVRSVTMDEVVCLHDVPPQYARREAPIPTSDITEEEVLGFYKFHFAPGLDRLFETSWYSEYGFPYIQQDGSLLDFTTQVMEQMTRPPPTAYQDLQSLEALLVWRLASMPRSSPPVQPHNGTMPHDSLRQELLPRIDALEHLLTGQFSNPTYVAPHPSIEPDRQPDAIKYNQQLFWHHLSRFTSLYDDKPDSSTSRSIIDCLDGMRAILSSLENRDVLYSLAIIRHFGGRLPDWRPHMPLPPPAEGSMQNELQGLQVACAFVEHSDHKGTTQVIQRVCGMGLWGQVLQKRE